MVLKLYNNDTILAPLKCGTRYLEECFGEPSTQLSLDSFKSSLHIKTLNTIIVRDPYEHLESAIHTELLGTFRQYGNSDVEILNNLDKFTTTAKTNQKTHWSPKLYETLYWYWRRNRRYIKIVDLKELSKFLRGYKKKLPKYDPLNYDFNHYDYWCSKEDVMIFVKYNYPFVWTNLVEQIHKSMEWYQLMLDEIVIEPKII